MIGKLLRIAWQNKWWWLTPMILLLGMLACLVALADSPASAPFTYVFF